MAKKRGPKIQGQEKKEKCSIRLEPRITKAVLSMYANLSLGIAEIVQEWTERKKEDKTK